MCSTFLSLPFFCFLMFARGKRPFMPLSPLVRTAPSHVGLDNLLYVV